MFRSSNGPETSNMILGLSVVGVVCFNRESVGEMVVEWDLMEVYGDE